MIKESNDPIACTPLPVAVANALTTPLRLYFDPQFDGLEHVRPDRPALYVGNHTIFGGIDWPLLMAGLYSERGVLLRGLADRAHYKIPVWRDLVPQRLGVVLGTRANCDRLMAARQHVLVYPGGSREICKRKGEQNALVWKARTGFAAMAIEHGYPILPFASVGTDDAFSILLDGDEIMRSPVGWLLRKTGIAHTWLRDGDVIPPVVRGLGLSVVPRPERMYFAFGKPISTRKYKGQAGDSEVLWELRERTASAIAGLIKKMQRQREKDQEEISVRGLLTRL